MINWIAWVGAIVIFGGCYWLLMRELFEHDYKNTQQPSLEDRHYRLGQEHALSGKKASLITEAYLDGFSDAKKALRKKVKGDNLKVK